MKKVIIISLMTLTYLSIAANGCGGGESLGLNQPCELNNDQCGTDNGYNLKCIDSNDGSGPICTYYVY